MPPTIRPRRQGFGTIGRGIPVPDEPFTLPREVFERVVFNGFHLQNAEPFGGDAGVPITAREAQQNQELETARRAQAEEQRRKNELPITIQTERVNDDGYEYYRITVVSGGRVLDEYHERSERMVQSSIRNIKERWQESKTMQSMRGLPEETKALDIRAQHFITRQGDNRRGIDRRSVRPAEDVVHEDGLVLNIEEENTITGSLTEQLYEEAELEIDQF